MYLFFPFHSFHFLTLENFLFILLLLLSQKENTFFQHNTKFNDTPLIQRFRLQFKRFPKHTTDHLSVNRPSKVLFDMQLKRSWEMSNARWQQKPASCLRKIAQKPHLTTTVPFQEYRFTNFFDCLTFVNKWHKSGFRRG